MATSTLERPTGRKTPARLAAVAFVASYSSPGTRQAYATQLRLWFEWCDQHHLEPLTEVRRPHVELYARDLESRGLAAATVALKLVVLTGFYRYCVEEQLLEALPGGPRPPAQGLPGIHPAGTRSQRAWRLPRPGRTGGDQ